MWGRGWGYGPYGFGGYGWGFGPGWGYGPGPYYRPSPEEERQYLLDYKAYLEEELAAVNRRLEEIEREGR